MQGKCKLCLTIQDLRDSHIMPRWTYRRLYKSAPPTTSGNQAPVQVHDGTALITSTQISEYLLCTSCEQRFSKVEGAVANVALQPDDTFPALKQVTLLQGDPDGFRVADGRQIPADLGFFALSVLWRASVSSHYPKIDLGERYNGEFRNYLYGTAGLPSNVRVMIELLDVQGGTGPRIDRLVIHPEGQRQDGYHVYQFAIFGFFYFIVVGAKRPGIVDQFCFPRTHRILLSDGARVLRSVAKAATNATPKGILAKRGR
ncbi:hypothetical protein WME98_08660 [Sorangium sp. So ce296]|uniref:hypothetical protein n=1 Tax=Sorangium sp. So ce296 TaxID=3133296 RepID=UPI003F5DF2FE